MRHQAKDDFLAFPPLLARPYPLREMRVLKSLAELVVLREAGETSLEPKDEEDLGLGAHRHGARARFDGAQGGPADALPLGDHLGREVTPESGEVEVFP